ncbi:hypothetical protein NX774_19920 [Massilia agilis]|uniref:Flagellar assembly protein T C-terminal domain-containing protein n=1 Tax=Massilia agilis TaxID=1811226 RepID=A0ABT2DFT9_9BURK|nr:hypothetical protein [Massilia agilis]MCS0810196.1 hypothetical protein [Massilia agilis]
MSDRYFGKVVKVQDRYTIVVNVGLDAGVKLGQRFLIVGLGETINDPDTGEPLEQLEIVRGKAQVTHVQSKIATLSSVELEREPETKEITKVLSRPSGISGLIAGGILSAGGQNTVTETIRPGEVRPKELAGVQVGDFLIRD